MNTETKKIIKTKDEVERLLKQYPEYRDNDERLVATFWFNEIRRSAYKISNMNAMDFLYMYAANQVLTSADCIVRARAKAQELHPELRGEKWKERHNIGFEVAHEIVNK